MRRGLGFFLAAILLLGICMHSPAEAQECDDFMAPGNDATADEMKHFIEGVKCELEAALFPLAGPPDFGEVADIARKTRDSGNEKYQNEDVYIIELAPTGTVTTHGRYMNQLYAHDMRAVEVVSGTTVGDLFAAAGGRTSDDTGDDIPQCVTYMKDGSERVACVAVRRGLLSATGVVNQILIAGFDHDPNDTAIAASDCSNVIQPPVTAQQVEENGNDDILMRYVQGTIKVLTDDIGGNPDILSRRIAFSKFLDCIPFEPWSNISSGGSIYLFIMDLETGTVIRNGNNPELNGARFENVFDVDDNDIWFLIRKAVYSDEGGGFIEYKWDNPAIAGDEVPENQRASGFGTFWSPGTSDKRSYVETTDTKLGSFIIGSGVYPASGAEDGDDGCALAGTGSPYGNGIVLFAAFALFAAVWLRRRAA